MNLYIHVYVYIYRCIYLCICIYILYIYEPSTLNPQAYKQTDGVEKAHHKGRLLHAKGNWATALRAPTPNTEVCECVCE